MKKIDPARAEKIYLAAVICAGVAVIVNVTGMNIILAMLISFGSVAGLTFLFFLPEIITWFWNKYIADE